MTVIPFPQKPATPMRFRVELAKGEDRRLFEVIPNVGNGKWQSWMRHNGRQLRALVIDDPLVVKTTIAEYEREIAALLADGWMHRG